MWAVKTAICFLWKAKKSGAFQRAGIRTSLYTPCHSSMLYGKGGLLWSRTMKTVAKGEEQRDEETMKERKKEIYRSAGTQGFWS